jgi:hypothetical protein
MARIETRDEESSLSAPPVGPPRRDDDLDDWFTRRLAAQGINAGRSGFPLARIVSVVALIAAVIALFWVLSSASGGGSSAATTTTTSTHQQTTSTNSTGTGGSTSKTNTKAPPTYKWNEVKVTVLNGNGQSGAAGTAQSTLQSAGWNVVAATDASEQVSSTMVVYPPHKKYQAEAVATKLGLPAPVPASTVSGVPTDLSTVAIVLGPDNLTGTSAG